MSLKNLFTLALVDLFLLKGMRSLAVKCERNLHPSLDFTLCICFLAFCPQLIASLSFISFFVAVYQDFHTAAEEKRVFS